jgi:hypothetical protein
MTPFWSGFLDGLCGGGPMPRLWGIMMGFACGVLFSYFAGGAWS